MPAPALAAVSILRSAYTQRINRADEFIVTRRVFEVNLSLLISLPKSSFRKRRTRARHSAAQVRISSVLRPRAPAGRTDVFRLSVYRRSAPIALARSRRPSRSFDDLIGAGEDRGRHGAAERLGGLEIDD